MKQVRWLTSPRIDHEGFPLYLRRPEYENIWISRDQFPNRLTIPHKLEKVDNNGLPESSYNKSLIEFDSKIVNLLDDREGFIFLIETFGGKRHYYYFIAEGVDYSSKINEVRQTESQLDLEVSIQSDPEWKFLEEYPIRIY